MYVKKNGFNYRYVKKSDLDPSTSGHGSTRRQAPVSGICCTEAKVAGCDDDQTLEPCEETKNLLELSCSHDREAIDKEVVMLMQKGVSEVVSNLQKMSLNVSKAWSELSPEQLRINDELQESELLALESIFGDNLIILDRKEGLRSLQINVHMEARKEFRVMTELAPSSGLDAKADNGNRLEFSVKYLQPLELTCLLPESYPSHQPPLFSIYAQWLISAKISDLCLKLSSIWMEQPEQEVIYQWVDWLRNYALSYLGFDEQIKLGPYGIKHSGDQRALSGSVSPDIDIASMQRYNEERNHEVFITNMQECCICYDESLGSEFMKLPCQHFFCWKCMKTFSDIHVSEGTVNKLHCPNTKCGGSIPPYLLKMLLSKAEYERWESCMLQKTLDSMNDIAYCPRCETPCLEDDRHDAQCSKCFYSFCTLCREKRHVGTECLTPELKLQILRERQESTSLREEQKRKELEMINNLLSLKEVLRDSKQCPVCQMAISKTEGCNKMECINCGKYFCYRCGKMIDGYEHFREGECDLFPGEEIARWEEQMNPRQVVGQIQAQLFVNDRHTCPNCGQFNVKMGNNNHIFCWACQMHYCYLCRSIVKKGSKHFGPRGCKQHTEG